MKNEERELTRLAAFVGIKEMANVCRRFFIETEHFDEINKLEKKAKERMNKAFPKIT